MARGGYRKPGNPAPVSGPGALSRRTDGGPTQGAKYMSGGSYGEGAELQGLQQAAPMAASPRPSISTAGLGAAAASLPPVVPLMAPTERPDEPFTTGMPFGEGAGPEILNMRRQEDTLSNTLAKIAPYDETGQVSEILNYLTSRGM